MLAHKLWILACCHGLRKRWVLINSFYTCQLQNGLKIKAEPALRANHRSHWTKRLAL